jgi:hypothetical protein
MNRHRFVVLADYHFASFVKHRSVAFPSLRVMVRKECVRLPPAGLLRPGCSARLYILRDTALVTLFYILRQPPEWCCEDDPAMPICFWGISYIGVEAAATLKIGDFPKEGLSDSLWNPALAVNIQTRIDKNQSVGPLARIRTTLEAIQRLMVSSGSTTTLSEVDFRIEDPNPTELEVWIIQVSRMGARPNRSQNKLTTLHSSMKIRKWLILKPELKVEVCIPREYPDTVDFQDIVARFRAMYETLWHEDARFRHRRDPHNWAFFTLYSLPSNNVRVLNADFTRHNGLSGFTVIIQNWLPDEDHVDVEFISASHFALDGAIEPFTAEEADDDAADNDHVSDSHRSDSSEDVSTDRDFITSDEEE